MVVTDRQTDRQTTQHRLICSSSSPLCSACDAV